ncbi:MAG: serine/threonine protein kinase [Myxococcales bacterium]|nr:serine/threonine protein kinase [Myxococcales bacterium]
MDRLCPRCHQRYPATTERCPLHDLPLRADPFIGARISRYTLTGFIGQGAMGVVYRAEPAAAIKILNARRAAMQPDLVRRFEVEAEATTRLQSPHIARTFESGTTDDGHLYIAMELLRGAPLDEILKRMNRVAADGAATIAYQAAHALAEAHDKAIVHRDLKPANLFAEPTPGGGGTHIRVLDFGVARINTESVARSRTGSVVGTPAYMSPEQLRGEVDIDGRSDVYSLGVVLYRMLAGFNPFRGEGGVLDTLRRHVEIIPAPLPPDVPPALAELTFDMLAKHRDARPPSMHAVRARLEGTGLVARASDEATLELATIPNLDDAAVDAKARENETTIGAGELRPAATGAKARRRWLVPITAAVVVAGGAMAWLAQRDEEEPPDRFVIASRLLDASAPAPTPPASSAAAEARRAPKRRARRRSPRRAGDASADARSVDRARPAAAPPAGCAADGRAAPGRGRAPAPRRRRPRRRNHPEPSPAARRRRSAGQRSRPIERAGGLQRLHRGWPRGHGPRRPRRRDRALRESQGGEARVEGALPAALCGVQGAGDVRARAPQLRAVAEPGREPGLPKGDPAHDRPAQRPPRPVARALAERPP